VHLSIVATLVNASIIGVSKSNGEDVFLGRLRRWSKSAAVCTRYVVNDTDKNGYFSEKKSTYITLHSTIVSWK